MKAFRLLVVGATAAALVTLGTLGSCGSGGNMSAGGNANTNTSTSTPAPTLAPATPTGTIVDQIQAVSMARRLGTQATRTDLVSDQDGKAAATDPHLLNAWGLAFNPKGPAWISANGQGTSQVYDSTGKRLLEVTIPPPDGAEPPSAPTGQVFNTASGDKNPPFMGDLFIFATEDGTIAGWQPSDDGNAVLRADNSGDGAIYKGITIAKDGTKTQLFAANFHAGTIDVFDDQYGPVTPASGAFKDTTLPAGFAPFNVVGIGPLLVVTYALQDDDKKDDVKGAGNGFIDVFTADGRFVQRLISGGTLDSPWGLAFAIGADRQSVDLAVGNFGDGGINLYNLTLQGLSVNATPKGALTDTSGKPIVIDGLWALVFGPGAGGFAADTLYFTAGPNDEADGLFGSLTFSGM